MKPRHPRSKPPVLRVESVPQQHADFVHSRCEAIVDHWGRNIRHLSLDHLVLSLYTQGVLDGCQVAERAAKRERDAWLPEADETSETSSV